MSSPGSPSSSAATPSPASNTSGADTSMGTTVPLAIAPVAAMMTRRTISIFNGKDYAIWAYHMRNLLEECGLENYWKPQAQITRYDPAKDRKALREIMFTLSNEQMKLVMNAMTANEAWKTLCDHHQQASTSNRFHLKGQLFTLWMKPKESIQEYANCINDLTNQVNSLSILADLIREEDKVLALIRGLPDTYNMVVSAMWESDKLLDYKHIIMSLLNDELRQNNGTNEDYDEKAFYGACGRGKGKPSKG